VKGEKKEVFTARERREREERAGMVDGRARTRPGLS
jgi:hypothetical protein